MKRNMSLGWYMNIICYILAYDVMSQNDFMMSGVITEGCHDVK